jgi:mannose-6-phosphate isomerase-like protein (cupin superfamily)
MTEILYLQSGQTMIDFSHGDDISKSESLFVKLGESFHVPTGLRHQYVAIKDIEVFDISTEHFKSNSYHMVKGD